MHTHRPRLWSALSLGVLLCLSSMPEAAPTLGVNTAFTNQTRVFKNLMAHSNGWIAVDSGYPLSGTLGEFSNPQTANFTPVTTRTTDQYPTGVDALSTGGTDLMAMTLIYPSGPPNGEFAAGQYAISFEGSGEVVLAGAPANGAGAPSISITSNPNGTTTQTLTFAAAPGESLEGVLLGIRSSDDADPIRNIQLVETAYADPTSPDYHLTSPFNPAYVEHLQQLAPSVLRTMNFNHVNGGHPCTDGSTDRSQPSCVASWSERATTQHASQSLDSGVALEHIVDLANELGSDLWLNVPHNAELSPDPQLDYATQMAALVASRLDPSLNVVIEYSNEAWNTSAEFEVAYDYTGAQGGLHPGNLTRDAYFALRQVDLINKFQDALGAERVAALMPGHAGNPDIIENRIAALANPQVNPPTTRNPGGLRIDAVSGAAYFGIEAPFDALTASQNGGPALTAGSILDLAELDLGQTLANFNDMAQALVTAGLADDVFLATHFELLGYEGGQHLSPLNVANGYEFFTVADFASEAEFDAFVDALNAANRDERMGNLYTALLTAWYDNPRHGVLNLFQDVGPFTEFGAFGLAEYLGQPLAEAPKLEAVVLFNAAQEAVSAPLSLQLTLGSLALLAWRRLREQPRPVAANRAPTRGRVHHQRSAD